MFFRAAQFINVVRDSRFPCVLACYTADCNDIASISFCICIKAVNVVLDLYSRKWDADIDAAGSFAQAAILKASVPTRMIDRNLRIMFSPLLLLITKNLISVYHYEHKPGMTS